MQMVTVDMRVLVSLAVLLVAASSATLLFNRLGGSRDSAITHGVTKQVETRVIDDLPKPAEQQPVNKPIPIEEISSIKECSGLTLLWLSTGDSIQTEIEKLHLELPEFASTGIDFTVAFINLQRHPDVAVLLQLDELEEALVVKFAVHEGKPAWHVYPSNLLKQVYFEYLAQHQSTSEPLMTITVEQIEKSKKGHLVKQLRLYFWFKNLIDAVIAKYLDFLRSNVALAQRCSLGIISTAIIGGAIAKLRY